MAIAETSPGDSGQALAGSVRAVWEAVLLRGVVRLDHSEVEQSRRSRVVAEAYEREWLSVGVNRVRGETTISYQGTF